MKSTGEVMGIDRNFEGALHKALLASGMALHPNASVLLSLSDQTKTEGLKLIHTLANSGYTLYATEGTSAMGRALGLEVITVTKVLSGKDRNVVDVIRDGTVQCVINTPEGRITGSLRDGFHIRRAAAEARIPCFTSIDTAAVAVEAMSRNAPYDVATLREYVGA
jgi:carbamoyl-phosphate synthase large subunit